MSYLLFSLLALLTVAALLGLNRSAQAGERGVLRWFLVALIAALPLLMAAGLFKMSQERLQTFQISHVGKQVAYSRETPITAGGGSKESEAAEDLRAELLPPHTLRIEPASVELAQEIAGLEVDEPVLRLESPSPVVLVNGKLFNSYAIATGSRIILGSIEGPLELEVGENSLRRGDVTYELPSSWTRLFRGGSSVVHLPDLLATLAPEVEFAQRNAVRSLLHRPETFGPWHLLIREQETTLVQGETKTEMQTTFAVPWTFDLRLQVTWGRAGRRTFKTVRNDEIHLDTGEAEIHFTRLERRLVEAGYHEGPVELGLTTSTTIDRRPRLIELSEPSRRFLGLSATLGHDPQANTWTLDFLGDRRVITAGELYAIGEEPNLLLVRFSPSFAPRRVLFDLALYGLFVLVFFGQAMSLRPALAALVAPVGILLGSRLLFSERAAASPPDFFQQAYAEARVALWLVPAAILLAWSLAWLFRRAERGTVPWKALRWPVLGLLVAGAGCALSTWGLGKLPWLAVGPWLAAGFLMTAVWTSGRPGIRKRLKHWSTEGWSWSYRTVLGAGVAILLLRLGAWLLGMPETIRLPSVSFRVLWTVVQLPICALIVALTAELIERQRDTLGKDSEVDSRAAMHGWLAGILSLGLFLGLAFVVVAVVVRDTGLFLAHGLAGIFALLLLAGLPARFVRWRQKARMVFFAGLFLACLPMLSVLTFNAQPGWMIALVGWGHDSGSSVTETQQVVDRAAQLSSTRAQQLFRLYMLAKPEELTGIGLRPSEQVAIHYETLRSYAAAAGWSGDGYASSRLPRHLGITYLSDLVPMVFVLADFGLAGIVGLTLVYLGLLALVAFANRPRGNLDPLSRQGSWIATLAVLAFSLPSLYMILANLNLVLFTGKNCNLLSLNSTSDVLESAFLLALAAFGIGLRRKTP